MADTNLDNNIPTNEQVAELFDIDTQSGSSDAGSRVPTWEQLKALKDSVGGRKKYTIDKTGQRLPEWVKTEAYPGEVVITSANTGMYQFTIYEVLPDGTNATIGNNYLNNNLEKLPTIVRQALDEIPQTLAPPTASDGYGWFIMPPCDVKLQEF